MLKLVVWKFPVPMPIPGPFELTMQKTATLLKVGVQAAGPVLWALVDPDRPLGQRALLTAFTGAPMSFDMRPKYVDSFDVNGLVYHVFDLGDC